MKNNVLILLLLYIAAGHSLADQTYVCSNADGEQQRTIKVIYQDQSSKVPCEVSYQADGKEQALFRSQDREGFCEKKALEFVQHQLDLGMACGDITPLLQVKPEALEVYSPEQVASYKKAAVFSQAVSVMTPFKMMMTEYYHMEGEYPDSLQKIGLRPEDMKTSAYVSDMTIGAGGEIYAQGNQDLGLDTVIMLKPDLTLGGYMHEWSCSTNIRDIDYCEHDAELLYPMEKKTLQSN